MRPRLLFAALLAAALTSGCEKHSSTREQAAISPSVIRGKELHSALLRDPKAPGLAKLSVSGSGTLNPRACIWVPEEAWNSYSEAERHDLVVYLQSLIPEIKRNPGTYIDIPASAPAYDKLKNNVARMGDDAFVIFSATNQGGTWIQKSTVAESL